MRIAGNIGELIGRTPLLELKNYGREKGLKGRLFAKLEGLNPSGSVKDRAALAMIEDAEESGKLKEGSVIIEPTSGNTGIGLAAVAASRGYELILVMPETMSLERRKLLGAYGARLELTEGALGMKGAIARAHELAREIPGSFLPGQFENEANPRAHERTTGPEIWEDLEGQVDVLVAGVGTGGTITGTGRYLKKKNPALHVAAVEPQASPVLSGGKPGPHMLQGIGAGFVPQVLKREIYDEVIPVENEAALEAARRLGRREGVLAGISSGAALAAAEELAARPEFAGKNIVVILPDNGDRYLSTALFSE